MDDYFDYDRRERITLEDIKEIIECYEYYLDTHCPMNQNDLAFVFNLSPSTIKKIMTGNHPLQVKNKKVSLPPPSKAVPPKAEVVENRVVHGPGSRPNRIKSHCYKGHELSGDNVYSYVKPSGHEVRKCRICQKANMDKFRRNAR